MKLNDWLSFTHDCATEEMLKPAQLWLVHKSVVWTENHKALGALHLNAVGEHLNVKLSVQMQQLKSMTSISPLISVNHAKGDLSSIHEIFWHPGNETLHIFITSLE